MRRYITAVIIYLPDNTTIPYHLGQVINEEEIEHISYVANEGKVTLSFKSKGEDIYQTRTTWIYYGMQCLLTEIESR